MTTRALPMWQVDAFADRAFRGNPAAVVLLEDGWLDDATLQAVALENNLSETAYLVPAEEAYELRWFTPTVEVELCGHATLASGHVVLRELAPKRDEVVFRTRAKGDLTVARDGDRLAMDFPAQPASPAAAPDELLAALGATPAETLRSTDWLCVFDTEAEVAALAPDFRAFPADARGVIAAAPGTDVEFVSRFFAPNAGVDEDPVTGSAHCTSGPYFAARLGRDALRARQISRRTGEVDVTVRGDRVQLAGGTVLYLTGTIRVPV